MQSNRAVFLDRDGVIIEEKVFIHNPDDVILINGAAEAIKRLSSMRLRVIVVTNQSGIGRGLFLKEDYQKVEERIDSLLRRSGASIDVSYYCPHAPREDCNCRKPRP
ncbi:MAG TPA: HAD-IIIA family hydrolase, partial [Synergistales bacterium]|nr:HAD-IIIA family hydrolase [Synergistales bacterium]